MIPELPEINSGFASCYSKFPIKIRVSGISDSDIPVSGYGVFPSPIGHSHSVSGASKERARAQPYDFGRIAHIIEYNNSRLVLL
jgi:hypothetical protein